MTLGGGVTMSNSRCEANKHHSKSAHKRDAWRQHNNDEITMCRLAYNKHYTQPTEQYSNYRGKTIVHRLL